MNWFRKLWNKITGKEENAENEEYGVEVDATKEDYQRNKGLIYNDPKGKGRKKAFFSLKEKWNTLMARVFKKSKSSSALEISDRADEEYNDSKEEFDPTDKEFDELLSKDEDDLDNSLVEPAKRSERTIVDLRNELKANVKRQEADVRLNRSKTMINTTAMEL